MKGAGRFAIAALGACWIVLTAATDGERAGARSLESQVLERINEARQDPRGYADRLRTFRRLFDGRILYLPDQPGGIVTSEGPDAVDEAIDFLERQRPLPALTMGEMLSLAARDHAEDQGAIGATGHVSRDGASPGERVRRRGGDIYVGESISYGFSEAEAVVRQLIVDDGVPGRGHRALLFKDDLRFAGVGCASHRRYRHMCVVDLSGTADGAPALPEWAAARGAQLFRMPAPRR